MPRRLPGLVPRLARRSAISELEGNRPPLVIVQLDQDEYSYCATAAGRVIGRMGIDVHLLHPAQKSLARKSRFVSSHSIDVPTSGTTLVEYLTGVHERIGQAVLLPIGDRASLLVDEYASQLGSMFFFPEQPRGLARALSHKFELYRLCRESGVPAPATDRPTTPAELEEVLARSVFPVVVKAMDSSVLAVTPGQRSVVLAGGVEEARQLFPPEPWTEIPNLMIQEYLPGGPDTVWMFNGYFDGGSSPLFGITARKLRQHPPATGVTSLGVCEPNDAVRELATSFLSSLGYRGIVDMGFRYDQRDQTYKLLDVNPRIGATFRLFSDENGLDVLQMLYLDVVGLKVPSQKGRSDGRRWVVEPYDYFSYRASREMGGVTARQWLLASLTADELAWFALDDPSPFVAMCGKWCRSVVAGKIRTFRS